jgi:GNAT superfamily N-acetyltransferase
MGGRIDQRELRRRAIDGVRDEVEAFGSGAPDSRLIRRDRLLAAVAPASPERSVFNSVVYEDGGVLAAELDALAASYDEAGVRAWTVWVPDEDREAAALLDSRGHLLDAAPRAMAMELEDVGPELETPSGVEAVAGDPATAAELNDRAYGYGPDGFRGALAQSTAIRWLFASDGEGALCCVGAIDVGDDCCVTGVATPPEHRGRGLASWLLRLLLGEARERGHTTATLQATKLGAPIYERLGFADHGFIEMWELRR